MTKAFQSAEFVNTDSDILELSSLSSESDSDESSGSTAVAEQVLQARDSIDRELDTMDRPPPDASIPAIVTPSTQQHQKKAKTKKTVKASKQPRAKTTEEPAPSESLTTGVVTYNISIFPVAKLKKDDLKKRKGTNTYLKLGLSEPFDMFKAQVLHKIDEQTKPQKIFYDNYKALYAIPRVSPTPMSLSNEKDYKEFIGYITKAKGLTASLYMQELHVLKRKDHPSDKENDGDIDSNTEDDSNEPKRTWKKKKKTQAPKASDIDDGNKPLNKNIRDLPDGGSHIALSFPLLECWGSAMLKGAKYATIEMPPNHAHFSIIPTELLGRPSLLSIRRQQLDEQTKAKVATAPSPPLTPSQPVINVNFPPESSQLPGVHATASESLLLPTQLATPGPRMSLADFCVAFDVSDALQAKLTNNGFTSSHSLHFASLDDLKTIGILCGELAQLKDTVSCWCSE
ncbi:hypothetical protein DFH29DRAFT_1003808 [Suillus ampliporus]|nr:hypothetical protein DFH29DRAFT_1003808 [Suillus ampliporus]